MNIAVLGYGTVGSGVVEVLTTNRETITKRAGESIDVKYVLDLRDFPGDPIQEKIVHDYQTILDDPDVKIVVEVMGGVEPAYTFVKKALQAGKSVATSNKELVAKRGAELLAIANEKNVNFLFEASVGGGIPIIRPLNQSLTADEIDEITGILNGTTNYMLTKMDTVGADYDAVLKEAQDKGYAERHPEADVEGYDACRKIAILTSLACGKQVDYEDIHTVLDINTIYKLNKKIEQGKEKDIILLAEALHEKKIGQIADIINEENKTTIMVTHDITEAISMSDKVIILTNRPGKIKKIIDINLEKPSTPTENRKDKNFIKYYDLIWKELDHHV